MLFLSPIDDEGVHASVSSCFMVTVAQIIHLVAYFWHVSTCVVFVYMCVHCVCVCCGGYRGLRSNNNLDFVLTEASEVASTPSSQCVVAQQPRVRCSRAALFVPYEWSARERKDGRRWGWEKERHKLVNGRRSLEGPWINAWANKLCLSLLDAIFLSVGNYFCFTVLSRSLWHSFFHIVFFFFFCFISALSTN